MTTAQIDWRKEPARSHFEMVQEGDVEPTIFPASDNYNHDRALMANRLECEYVEVRMETYWMVWAPEDAEEEWRRERCECEHPAGGDDNWYCEPISACKTTKPAEDVWDFWDARGIYCPWTSCKPSTPGAVKFRRGSVKESDALRDVIAEFDADPKLRPFYVAREEVDR